eukprot:6177897-Pleurochrysis_carterae.AAC.6
METRAQTCGFLPTVVLTCSHACCDRVDASSFGLLSRRRPWRVLSSGASCCALCEERGLA